MILHSLGVSIMWLCIFMNARLILFVIFMHFKGLSLWIVVSNLGSYFVILKNLRDLPTNQTYFFCTVKTDYVQMPDFCRDTIYYMASPPRSYCWERHWFAKFLLLGRWLIRFLSLMITFLVLNRCCAHFTLSNITLLTHA